MATRSNLVSDPLVALNVLTNLDFIHHMMRPSRHAQFLTHNTLMLVEYPTFHDIHYGSGTAGLCINTCFAVRTTCLHAL